MPENLSTSTAVKPDLDWSQVRETINMLTLAVSQVECTMTDGEKSVAELTESFTYIANQLQSIIDNDSESKSEQTVNGTMQASASDIHERVVSAIIAFQFYDRLSQRLDHVKRDLGWLSDLVSNPQQLYNPESWKKLQQDIMSNYSMDEERIMFQHIMDGASVDEALDIYHHHFSVSDEDGDSDDASTDEIELF